tara:strand:+ start:1116 stop:1331 length:216 start_codon:yes stop_codon:yes gene_type:complete
MKDSNENQEEKKGVIDNVMERAISRKLLVFAVATALLYLEVGLDADTWGMIAMTYIGGQTAIDFAKTWRHG